MQYNRIRNLLFTLLLVLSSSILVQAQDEALPLTQELSLGELSLLLPEGWTAFPAQGGAIVIANVDVELASETGEFPDETLLIQLNLLSTGVLAELEGEVTALNILSSIPQEDQADATAVETIVNDKSVASINLSTEETDAIVYAVLFSEKTFAFLVTGTLQPGIVAQFEPTILEIVGNLELEINAEVSEETLTRYDDLNVGQTEEGFPSLGSPDAPVTIHEISSFDCPACKSFHDNALPTILERVAAGDVQFVYVPIFGTGGIPSGDVAARASLCAAEQGGFWPFHDLIFGWQEFGGLAFIDERLSLGIENLGLDVASFETCLASENFDILDIAFDFAGNTEGFAGTPTVLVNGTVLANWGPDSITAAIDSVISGE